ncbi:MAG: glycosyltransferase family 4 protein [Magnetospirillum sp.]|nr:glycosyltransferase family 4 protein [Magnetospirillum sp.]
MTRVLINAVHAKSGGGVTYLRNVLPLLAARGDLDLTVAIQEDQRDTVGPLAAGLPLVVLPRWGKLATVLVQEQVVLPRLAHRLKAAVVFSPANYGPLFGVRGVIMLRNAFEVASLERRLDKRLYWQAVRWLSAASFARCRRAITVSAHAGANFRAAFGLKDDPRIVVVHHGVAPAFHPPAEAGRRTPYLLLAVSDLYVQKGLETAIAAVAELAPRFPALRLEIAGRPLDPAYHAGLVALAAELGVSGRVAFLGGLPPAAVAERYRAADVFVFPSLVETFGNPVLEALASGVPVVCSDAAAMPEVAGPAALYAPPKDAGAFAAAIARLLDDRNLWAAMSARGVARAAAFTWERTAEATARVLTEAAILARAAT